MELMTEDKKGFKRTDVGLIPEDWEVKQLKDCISEPLQYGIGAAAVDYNLNLPRYLRITDISDEGYLIEENKASVKVKEYSNYLLENDDIVLARTGASVGKSYLFNRDNFSGEMVFAGFLIKVKSDTKKLNPIYLKYFFKSDPYWHWVKVNSMRSGQPGINSQEYSSLKLPLPPTLEEQQAIASALSDVDELIRSINGLIQKKQAIKKGTMQQLLTGKKRLPGFDGEWEVKKLGDFADIQRGASPRPISDPKWFSEKKDVGWVRISDIKGKYLYKTRDYLSNEGIKRSRFLEKGSLIMSIAATVGLPVITRMDLCIHDGFVGFWNLRDVDQEYLYYKLKFYRSELEEEGQTGSQSNINSEIVRNFEKRFPSLEEQKSIAQTLSDMDRELQTLRQKREKYVQIKQGMMQQLLTGRIRIYGMDG